MKTIDKPISIFLVDDDNIFLSTLKHSLEQRFKSRIEVTCFSTGEECLTRLSDNPDIVILDYYLNSEMANAMNGIQVLKKIKDENNSTLVIMLSSQDKLEVVSDSFKNGAFEYVVKSETFFIRIENVVKNIVSNIEIDRETHKYEKWNYVVGVLLIVFLICDVIYYKMH